MESRTLTLSQLFLRIALAASFLSAVADRFGFWGAPGEAGVNWGSWENFLAYSNTVNSFVSEPVGAFLAVIATALEIIIPILLLIGFKLRLAAISSGVLLTLFAIGMTISFGIKPSLDYSVWTGAAGSFLLSAIPSYEYSVDSRLK
jgi:uncharacterized membrane protein YphA (DoxX/SURF4 family)